MKLILSTVLPETVVNQVIELNNNGSDIISKVIDVNFKISVDLFVKQLNISRFG